MIITTTPTIENQPIKDYKGVVFSEVVLGVNMFTDFGAGLRNIFGGRSQGYEQELRKGQHEALKELEERAKSIGANAIVGMKLDYEILGTDNGMMMIIGSGTAVQI
ncbi:TPA: heavy metal-binding domain-containing protein [Streptococcus suis]